MHHSFQRTQYIERTLEHFDGQRTVTIPRNRLALKKDAVPCIFPNCPSYLSDHNIQTKRLSKDDKERLTLEEAFSQSLRDIMYEIFLKIDSHSDLSKSFYEGSCRRKLVRLAMLVIEKKIPRPGEIGVLYGFKMGNS